MADGWEDVTDPGEIRKVLGKAGGGKGGLSGAETKELSDARTANTLGRDTFKALADTYRVASRYPGGIPSNVADSWGAALGLKDRQVQDQQLFTALSNRAAVGQAKLLAPASNTDIAILQKSGANPALRFENNQSLIEGDYGKAARAYFENAFKQRWAAKNGGLNGTDKQGRSYAAALAEAMRRPDVQQLLVAPWRRGMPGGPVAASGQWKVVR